MQEQFGQENRRRDDTAAVIKSIGRGATSTVKLQGKLLKKIYLNTIGAVLSRFWRATLLGKMFVLLGLGGAVCVGVLAYRNALAISIDHREHILVTASRANVRASNSATAPVITRVRRGDELTQMGESEAWWFVKGKDWEKPGWVSRHVARPAERIFLTVDYEMKGYGIAFIASLVLIYLGFCLKRT